MSFEENMDNINTKAVRESVGSQLLLLAAGIAKHAAMVSEETYSRLISVSCEISPHNSEPSIDVEQWPSFFSELRSSLLQIDDQLYSIHQTIQRVEV